MSNHLAIATVTAVLQKIVETAARSEVPGAEVRIGRPDTAVANQGARIALYLYQVAPNAALRNNDLPTYDSAGKLVSRPQAALELYYLLSFQGEESDQTPERMMGAVIRDLHARPLLSHEIIERRIGGDFILGASDLHQEVELVRLTPFFLSLDEASKLWSVFFQTPHARFLTYRASVVLIDAVEASGPARPVLRRGEDDQGVQTLVGPFPYLSELRIDNPITANWRPQLPSYPSAQLGWRLTLRGSNLGGEIVHVCFKHPLLENPHQLTPVSVNINEIVVDLPQQEGENDAERWPAGIYTVSVNTTQGDETHVSNVLPLALAPHITEIQPPNPIDPINDSVTLIICCNPSAHPKQTTTIMLAGREYSAKPDEAMPEAWTIKVEKAPKVKGELLYLRVDGVDSMPFKPAEAKQSLVFDDAQMVTIQ